MYYANRVIEGGAVLGKKLFVVVAFVNLAAVILNDVLFDNGARSSCYHQNPTHGAEYFVLSVFALTWVLILANIFLDWMFGENK